MQEELKKALLSLSQTDCDSTAKLAKDLITLRSAKSLCKVLLNSNKNAQEAVKELEALTREMSSDEIELYIIGIMSKTLSTTKGKDLTAYAFQELDKQRNDLSTVSLEELCVMCLILEVLMSECKTTSVKA